MAIMQIRRVEATLEQCCPETRGKKFYRRVQSRRWRLQIAYVLLCSSPAYGNSRKAYVAKGAYLKLSLPTCL
jgi:hypothetical protein